MPAIKVRITSKFNDKALFIDPLTYYIYAATLVEYVS